MARIISRRTTQTLLALLSLFLLGTIGFLWAVRSYFSIDEGAIIRSEELGTLQDILLGRKEATLSLPSVTQPAHADFDDTIAQHAAAAAKAAGFGDDVVGFIPSGRNNTPKAWNAATDPPERIPRIIHQTWKEAKLPAEWQAVRDECQRMHPDYKYMLWTDADSRKFLQDNYAWFIPTFDAYPYPIQRADAIRYFVLHKYGGIYMDLDVGCLRRFDPLLRFEVVLPKTIPVGVSNDVMASAKGHPFMDHLIHNLATFNHRYLTHYPTVMFSTGPMFVSASYGLYVDAHGLAAPSTPEHPSAGFVGIRVLPKSLYGKNAKPSEAPDAFFRHFYGSSWHAGDAGFLIFLRERGRLLIFIGVVIVAYGFARSSIARAFASLRGGKSSSTQTHSSRRRGRWISLPFVRDPQSGEYRSVAQDMHQKPYSRRLLDEATQTQTPTTAGDMREAQREIRVAAPRPQRATVPLLDYVDSDNSNADDDFDLGPGLNADRIANSNGILGWMSGGGSGGGGSRPTSAASQIASGSASPGWTRGRSGSASKAKATLGGSILYLPAFLVGSGANSSSSSASQDWTFANAQEAATAGDDSLDNPAPSTTSATSTGLPWKLTKAHSRSASTSQNRSLATFASTFTGGGNANDLSTGGSGGGAASQVSAGLQKVWTGMNWGGRTPSPGALLGNTMNRLRMSFDGRDGVPHHDLESPPLEPEDSPALQRIGALRMASTGSSHSSLLARTASMNNGSVGGSSSGDVIVPADEIPPPYFSYEASQLNEKSSDNMANKEE